MLKAIILSAGQGTRLKPLTDNCPKPMIKIGSKPVLEHTVNMLKKHGVTDIAINLHHYPQVVMDYFGDGKSFGVRMHYSLEKEILGTAGAVKKLKGYFDDTFVVVYGDVFSFTDITAMMRFHKGKKGIATIGLYEVDNPHECGIVELTDDNKIAQFLEKPKKEEIFTDMANAGIYILETEIMNYIPQDVYYDFGKDLFPLLLKNGIAMYGFIINEYLIDIGTMKKYEQANRDFMEGVTGRC